MAEKVPEWMKEAESRQQEICSMVMDYDWESYKQTEKEYLERKVQYLLFGLSEEKLDKNTEMLINSICLKIIEEGCSVNNSDGTCMAYIYVVYSEDGNSIKYWPVFKVPKDNKGVKVHFIDVNSRVYKDWTDFLNNNQFPPCEYCYPRGGEYVVKEDGKVLVEFGKSPASSITKNIIQYMDFANSGLAFGTTAVAAASLFVPVAGPLLQASLWLTRGVCAYTTLRSGTTLYDRKVHEQSVGLKDGESRNCWLSIAGSTLGVLSTSASNATARMAQSGQVVGKVSCATVTTLNVGSIAVNGLGMLNGFQNLVEKHRRNELTTLDVFQFSASLLLFAHATVNIQTAKSIIENTQKGVLTDFENSLRSNRHRRMFRKVVRNTRDQQNPIEGNAQVIRSLKHINNVDDYFSALVRMDKQFRPTRSKVEFTDGGFVRVNGHLSIDPTLLVQANKEQRLVILEATKQYGGNQISESEFRSMTETIIGKIPAVPANASTKIPTLKELLGIGEPNFQAIPKISVEFSFPLLSAYERMELMIILKKFADSDCERILKMASTLFAALGCTTGLQFVEVAYFVCGFIRNIARNGTIKKSTDGRSFKDYCQAALTELFKDPTKLMHIFLDIRSLFEELSTRSALSAEYQHVGLFEIAQLSSILLHIERPLWLKVIIFAEEIFRILKLRQPELIIGIFKELCLKINQVLDGMERNTTDGIAYGNELWETASQECSGSSTVGSQEFTEGFPNAEQLWNEASGERTRNCAAVINTFVEDAEIRQSFVEDVSTNCLKQFSDRNIQAAQYTKQKPLVQKRSFWLGDQLVLLSEEEILDICRQVMTTDEWPTDCAIEYSGQDVLINVDDKLIIIINDIDEGIVSAYIDTVASLQ